MRPNCSLTPGIARRVFGPEKYGLCKDCGTVGGRRRGYKGRPVPAVAATPRSCWQYASEAVASEIRVFGAIVHGPQEAGHRMRMTADSSDDTGISFLAAGTR